MGDGTCRPRLSEGQAGQEEGGGCGGAATRDGVRPAEKGSRDAPTAAAPPRGGRSVPAACRPQCSAVGGGGGGGRCPDPLNTVPPAGCPTQCGGGHALGGGRARGHCKREGASAPSFARVSAWRDLPYSYQTREGVLARVGGGVGGGGWRRPCPFIRQPRPPREPPPTPTRRPPPPPPPCRRLVLAADHTLAMADTATGASRGAKRSNAPAASVQSSPSALFPPPAVVGSLPSPPTHPPPPRLASFARPPTPPLAFSPPTAHPLLWDPAGPNTRPPAFCACQPPPPPRTSPPHPPRRGCHPAS